MGFYSGCCSGDVLVLDFSTVVHSAESKEKSVIYLNFDTECASSVHRHYLNMLATFQQWRRLKYHCVFHLYIKV